MRRENRAAGRPQGFCVSGGDMPDMVKGCGAGRLTDREEAETARGGGDRGRTACPADSV